MVPDKNVGNRNILDIQQTLRHKCSQLVHANLRLVPYKLTQISSLVQASNVQDDIFQNLSD